MKKATLSKIAVVILIVFIAVFVISACDSPPPRIAHAYYYSPGGPFQTNITAFDRDDNPDPRRQLRISIVFEVIDEAAIEELGEVNFIVRNAVLQVMGELTMEEITVYRNLDDLIERFVERINEDIQSNIDMVVWGYFTEFSIV